MAVPLQAAAEGVSSEEEGYRGMIAGCEVGVILGYDGAELWCELDRDHDGEHVAEIFVGHNSVVGLNSGVPVLVSECQSPDGKVRFHWSYVPLTVRATEIGA